MNAWSSELKPITKNKSLVEEVVQTLSTYILHGLMDGTIKPGDKLPSERELSKALNIGRSTLREATQVLVILRLLVIKPGQGTFVVDDAQLNTAPFSWGLMLQKKSLDELIEFRILLESECAGLAALRATKEDIALLEESYKEMEDALLAKKEDLLVEADIQFHINTSLATKNNIMYVTLNTTRSILQNWISRVFQNDGKSLEDTVNEHKKILQAIKTRNYNEAKKYMKEHIFSASERLRKSI